MEEKIPRKPVELSDEFKANRTHVYDYTFDMFCKPKIKDYDK